MIITAAEMLKVKNLVFFKAGLLASLSLTNLDKEEDTEFKVKVRCNMAKAAKAPKPTPKAEKKPTLKVSERKDHLKILPINIKAKHNISNQTSAMIMPSVNFCNLPKLSIHTSV
jgi:hypothetical protein